MTSVMFTIDVKQNFNFDWWHHHNYDWSCSNEAKAPNLLVKNTTNVVTFVESPSHKSVQCAGNTFSGYHAIPQPLCISLTNLKWSIYIDLLVARQTIFWEQRFSPILDPLMVLLLISDEQWKIIQIIIHLVICNRIKHLLNNLKTKSTFHQTKY